MANFFNKENNVFEKQLKNAFKPSSENDQNSLFKAISLVFYHDSKLSDIYDAYKILGLENFVRIINLFDGRVVRFPTSTELKDAIILALCFYYKEIENLTWEEIHNKVPFKFSSLTISYKIKGLNNAIKAELTDIFKCVSCSHEDIYNE